MTSAEASPTAMAAEASAAASLASPPTASHKESAPSEGTEAAPKVKKINVLGFQLQASEDRARKLLIGAGFALAAINGFGLPFALPKMRKFLGAPYVPMKKYALEAMFVQVLPTWLRHRSAAEAVSVAESASLPLAGLKLVDFGSGDGRIVAAAARQGMHAVGYEINPYLVLLSKLKYRNVGPGTATFRWANAWNADLKNIDVMTVYGRTGDGLMAKIRAKCEREMPRNSAVVSHHFDMPGWEKLLVQDVQYLRLYDLSRLRSSPGTKPE
eukprot:TRINITY_DN43425_c0_g1_i1.p1 TRINITY_DN43425_c0_g1~~TRINITY_DN43425_c0_g1_i1.p1  ORF type:complete len:270 (+),score=49.63 TRINITY_DN43425_c0_g1_i1:105-914(+)